MVTIAQVLRELNDAVSDVRINTSKRLWYPLVEDILKKYNLEFNFEITYNGIDIITTDETYRVEDQFCLMDTLLDEDGSFETANQKTLVEAANELLPILIPTTNLPIDPAAKEKFITVDTKPLLELMTTWLSGIEVWDEETIRATITKQLEDKLLTLKDISQPIRVCLTGRTNSPDLFAVMVALGKWETIERIYEHIR